MGFLTHVDGLTLLSGAIIGFLAWFLVRHGLGGFFTVNQNERAVLTSFGRAHRSLGATSRFSEAGVAMREDEKERYDYPQLQVIPPGGPYLSGPGNACTRCRSPRRPSTWRAT